MRLVPAGRCVTLRVLGPLSLLKVKFEPEGYPRRMVGELWFLPDGTRILELSTKCSPAEAFQAGAETKIFLAGHGADRAKWHALWVTTRAQQRAILAPLLLFGGRLRVRRISLLAQPPVRRTR